MKKTLTAIFSLALIVAFTNFAEAKPKKKTESHDQAKKECLEENPGISGKTLQKCIKQKKLSAAQEKSKKKSNQK